MKKVTVFIGIITLLLGVVTKAQVTLKSSFDFENGLPDGWTTSSTTNVTVEDNSVVAINGSKFARVKHGTTDTYLQSSLITVNAGEQVRLEFNHIPMTKSSCRIQLVTTEGTTISLSGNNVYDNKYSPLVSGQGNSFKYTQYYTQGIDISQISKIDSSMWRHEIYYLTGKLNGKTSFYVKFNMNKTTDNGYGWLIDDVKLYTTTESSSMVPRFNSIVQCPTTFNYPYCSDAEIEFMLSAQTSALSNNADEIYVEYFTPGDQNINKVNLTKNTADNYFATIPYMGIDSVVYWRAVVTDALGNQTSYPFTGNFHAFKYVRPYYGNQQLKETATGSESLVFATKSAKVSHQIRYSANELKTAGYGAGLIGGFYLNIKSRPKGTVTLSNFKVFIGSLSPNDLIDAGLGVSQYANITNVINQASYLLPDKGWQYLAFDDDKTFVWDGESDIIIKVCFDGNQTFDETKVQSYPAGNNNQYKTHRLEQPSTSSVTACTGQFNTDATGMIAFKPNIRFNFINKCYFHTNAGIRQDTILSPASAVYCNGNLSKVVTCTANTPTELKVWLRNDGLDNLTKLKVKWMIDDNVSTMDSANWIGNMNPLDPITKKSQDSTIQFIPTTTFKAPAGVHTLKIWVEMPDATTIDWDFSNDTLLVKLFVKDGPMSGVYALGGQIEGIPASRTFATFEEAFIMLKNSTVGGACQIKIANDGKDIIYKGDIKFPACIDGLSETNTITFMNDDNEHQIVFMPDEGDTSTLINMSDLNYLTFKNLVFSMNPAIKKKSNENFSMVRLNSNSKYLTFDSCKFISYGEATNYFDRIASIFTFDQGNLTSDIPLHLTINNCLFETPAKNIIDVKGTSVGASLTDVNILNSYFHIISDSKQGLVESVVLADMVKKFRIEQNTIETSMIPTTYSKITSVFYALQFSNSNSLIISKNKFKLNSISAVSLANVDNSIISNNLISLSNVSDNTIAYSQYGINLQSGTNNKIVYNNLYAQSLNSSIKKNYALSLGTTNLTTTNNQVKNNIIESEGYGYGVALRPSDGNSFILSNNLYYKKATIPNLPFFTIDTDNQTDTTTWKNQTNEVNSFYNEDPMFIAWDNLYAMSIFLCEKADWIPEVTDDFFGVTRPLQTVKRPCIGSREFDPPLNNIHVLKVGLDSVNEVSDGTYTGCDLKNEKIFINFKNISPNTIPANTLHLNYSVNGIETTAVVYKEAIEPNIEKHFVFPAEYNFQAINGNKTFEIKAFSVLDIDTVKTNDTTSATVISYYRLPALTEQNVNVEYGHATTVDITALCPNDSIYWYYKPDDLQHFYKGHSFTTENLYTDSTIYFARRDEVPILRISEIQYYKDANKEGITPNMPNYISVNNAYEISNCGSQDVAMGGYQFVYYTGEKITKAYATYTFPNDYVLAGNSSVVLVATATSNISVENNVAIAINAEKFKVKNTTKGGFAIKNSANKYIDALTVNGAIFTPGMNVPIGVWSENGDTVKVSSNSAGIIRNNVKSTTASGWTIAKESNPMSMGTYNDNLTDHTENLCLGYMTPYKITMINVPNYDPGITEIVLSNANNNISSSNSTASTPYTDCGLGEYDITVTISNTGLQTLTAIPIVCEVYEGDVLKNTFNATYSQSLNKFESDNFTFTSKIDLTSNIKDRNIMIKVYTAHEQDIVHNNDTICLYIVSLHTPIPPVAQSVTVNYSEQATLIAQSDYTLIWYKTATSQEELARGTTYQTPVLYENATYYVEAFNNKPFSSSIGKDSVLVNANNPSPSPFNAKTKNVKEQYLLKADTLLAYGYNKGNINGFSTKISAITGATSSAKIPEKVVYNSYNVKIGKINQDELSTWVGNLTTVYSDTLQIPSSFKGWRDIVFSEPYYWDGISDLVIEVCFSVDTTASVITFTKATSGVSSLNTKNTSNDVCGYMGNAITFSKIPYMKLNMDLFGCRSERTPVNVIIQNLPVCDIGLKNIVSPANSNIISGEPIPIEVEIKNFGMDSLSSATIKWKVNSDEQTPYIWTAETPLAQNQTAVVTIGNYTFEPGLATIEAVVTLECDNTKDNDTIVGEYAACIGTQSMLTSLTIGGTNGKYASIKDAIEDLTVSGVCGPIEFLIAPGIYDERITLTNINGVSEENTITFRGDNTVGNVIVKYDSNGVGNEEENNHLLKIDAISNIYFKNITFKANNSFNNLAKLKNVSNVHFNNVRFESINGANSKTVLVDLEGMNNNVFFTSSEFVNGANAIKTEVQQGGIMLSKIEIDSCLFLDFKGSAIEINDYNDVKFRYNKVRSHANDFVDDAIKFRNIGGVSSISANEIILSDGGAKARSAIVIRHSNTDDVNPLEILNNSIAVIGSGASKLKTHGIDIDSSNFVNIYYNTVYLKVSTNNNNARSLFIGKTNTNIVVRNNNLDNECGGYAYYVEGSGAQVVVSDNNNYVTNANKFAYWSNKDCANITSLRTTNTFDINSMSVKNKFLSDTCLEFLSPTDIIFKAEPIEGYSVDIYGNVRPVIPKPTIGAYEYQFVPIDAGIVRIISPVTNTTYIEGDDIEVKVVVENFGITNITSLPLVVKYGGHIYAGDIFQQLNETYNGTITSLDSAQYLFTTKLKAKLNTPYTDSAYVQVFTTLNGDTINYNDTMSVNIKIIPGKDLNCVSVRKQNPMVKCGANMKTQQIGVLIKNVGNKAVDQGDVINITYVVKGETGGIKAIKTEQITFPLTYTNSSGNSVTLNSLQPNAVIQYYTFNTTVNLEATGNNDTTWSIYAYAKLVDDSNPLNDTTTIEQYLAYLTPPAPVAHDTSVYYGTKAQARASHIDSLSIRWYHSTTDNNPFYKHSKYEQSTILNINKPIYSDTEYYVNVVSKNSGACPSDFVKVKVNVLPRCAVDIKALSVVEPPSQPKKGYIYMSEDTVKVKLVNFGTQTVTNFPITCSIKPVIPTNAPAVLFTETCDATLVTDDTVTYVFKKLFDFTSDTTNYEVKVWVEQGQDCVHDNDTTPTIKVMPLFSINSDSKVVGEAKSLNITRVQLASMDNISSSVASKYSDFTSTVTPPDLFKGLKDSLLIDITPSSDMKILEDQVITGWVKAWIDWDRNGVFDTTSETVYSGQAAVNGTCRTMIDIPEYAMSGYTMMRVIVSQDDSTHKFGPTPGSTKYALIPAGEIEDYKIHILPIKNINAELVKFVTPQRQDTTIKNNIVVRLRNAGKTKLTQAKITWIYDGDTNVYDWTGSLESSEIADVELANKDLKIGYNKFKAYVTVAEEEYLGNDTITLDNYIYPIYDIPYNTEFDEQEIINYDFYAYEADPKRKTNLWQIGKPSAVGNNVIKSAYSKPICWKTNIDGQYTMNNTSMLYSPIFNIEEIKPDTLSFMMRREMGPGATMVVEYLNYKGVWKTLGVYGDAFGKNWYDSEDGFTKTNVAWEKSSYSMNGLSGDLGKRLQFRFVFTSLDGHIADGVAIDNFKLDRALRDYDAGVTAIELTPEELPSYGQYFYPKVKIHNYGKKAITAFKVCYLAEDMYITQCEDVAQTIPVGGDIEYTFTHGRYLNVSMPDPFSIMAYTRLNPNDLYTDNDTTVSYFVIGPLLHDVGLLEITEPLTKVASNDNVDVAVKLKNYGVEPIENLPIYYTAGGGQIVEEIIHFVPTLNSGDEYTYTFKKKYSTPFGTVNLKVWTGLQEDIYSDNDTLYLKLQASNTSVDVEAKYITLDDISSQEYGLQLALMNRSSKPVKNITVGYYLNGDKTTTVEEIFRTGGILEASTIGYHKFSQAINRSLYQSICAYVKYEGDENKGNDTTCNIFLGYRDVQADTIMIEQNVNKECVVQLRAHHIGTLAGNGKIKAAYVLNGDYSHPVRQTFTIESDEPIGRTLYLTFSQKIPRSDDSKYNIIAWIEYANDNNHSNDTTSLIKIQTYVGLEEEIENGVMNKLIVEQNRPNPFTQQTVVEVYLPNSGYVILSVQDNNGRVVYTHQDNYSSGVHYITLPLYQLSAGTYYYTVRYKEDKITKKMIKLE